MTKKDGHQWTFPTQINSLSHPLLHCLPIWGINQMAMANQRESTKTSNSYSTRSSHHHGQMESSTLDFIAQPNGNLTTKRYQYATIFVDHYSKFGFIYLHKTLSSEETVQAKKAFEAYASNHNVTILHYHADNGHFSDNTFISHCQQEDQSLTYCGVDAHHQNGVAKKWIPDLQDQARIVLYAMHKLPCMINSAHWLYAH